MKNFTQTGNTLSVLLTAAILSGQGRLTGNIFFVAATDGADEETIEGQVTGCFDLPKTSANTPGQFAAAYWDVSAGEVTTTAADNYLIGVFTDAYGSGTTTANVRLNGIATFVEPGA